MGPPRARTEVMSVQSKSTPSNAVGSSLPILSMGVITSDDDNKETLNAHAQIPTETPGGKKAPRYTTHRPPPVLVNSPRTRESSDGCLTWLCSCVGTEDGHEEKDAGRECVSVEQMGFACCILCLAVAPVL